MTEQEIKTIVDQLKKTNIFEMVPGYSQLPKINKEAMLEAFQASIDKEKAKIANEQ